MNRRELEIIIMTSSSARDTAISGLTAQQRQDAGITSLENSQLQLMGENQTTLTELTEMQR